MNKATLLYAEDDRETLEGTSFLLRNHFTEIFTAKNGEEAFEIYKDKKPDILLLDINMPKMDGMELAKKIRKSDDITPIIFLTAHSETTRLLEAIDIGTYSYVIKPFRIDELKKPILKLLDKLKESSPLIDLKEDYFWDEENEQLYFKNNMITLTKNEYFLINILLKNKSRFMTAQDIAYEFYEITNKEFEINNIVQLISRFRKKLIKETNKEEVFLENIYGSGYRIK